MKLKKINLSKGNGHHHPDIKSDGTYYLVKHRSCNGHTPYFMAGSFNEQWYGLNFLGGPAWSCQFDTPGSNGDTVEDPRWIGIWEIVDDTPQKPKSTNIGDKIKFHRERIEMSQFDLATKLHYSSSTSVGHWECGRRPPPAAAIKLMAEIFGISEKDLQ